MFENSESAKRQILRDKHTLLEGYITEYLYENQFLQTENSKYISAYTHGWWSAETDIQRFFFVVTPALNDVDREVAAVLSKHHEVWRAYPTRDSWYFYNNDCRLSLPEFLQRFNLSKIRSDSTAAMATRNELRQKRCLHFFETHGLLTKIAIERNFADDILTSYFNSIVNIDFFARKSSGKLSAIEVKYKFESRQQSFGINVGQFRMFELLTRAGMDIQHWILYNSTHDKELSVFGFLSLPGKKWWRYGAIHTDTTGIIKTAPAETSVQGNKRQGYYEFNADHFRYIQPLDPALYLEYFQPASRK